MIQKFLRKLIDSGWTQQQIAEKAGIKQQTVSKCLQGKTCTVETLIKLAMAFNVSTDTVLGLDTPPEEPPLQSKLITKQGSNSYGHF